MSDLDSVIADLAEAVKRLRVVRSYYAAAIVVLVIITALLGVNLLRLGGC